MQNDKMMTKILKTSANKNGYKQGKQIDYKEMQMTAKAQNNQKWMKTIQRCKKSHKIFKQLWKDLKCYLRATPAVSVDGPAEDVASIVGQSGRSRVSTPSSSASLCHLWPGWSHSHAHRQRETERAERKVESETKRQRQTERDG